MYKLFKDWKIHQYVIYITLIKEILNLVNYKRIQTNIFQKIGGLNIKEDLYHVHFFLLLNILLVFINRINFDFDPNNIFFLYFYL